MQDIFTTIRDELLDANPKATHLPDLIRAFHTTQSKQEFDGLFKQFTEFIHPLGLITAITPPATRILLQLLEDTDNIHRKQSYTQCLYYILSSTLISPNLRRLQVRRIRFDYPDYPTQFRDSIAIYDIIFNNQQLFIEQCQSDNAYFVVTNIALLSMLRDQDIAYIHEILRCINYYDDVWVKSIGAWAFAEYNYHSYKSRWEDYDKLLLEWVKNGESFTFRVCAALGYMLIYRKNLESQNGQVPEVVVDTLAEYLSIDIWKRPIFYGWNLHYFVLGQMPFNRFDEDRILYKNGDLSLLLEISRRSNLTPAKAHHHYRELLDIAFRKINRNESDHYWESHAYIDVSDLPDQLLYEYPERLKKGQYHPNKPLNNRHRQVLHAIVNCDPFWEIPTNLFSYFYGLPDNKEDLQRLANQG